MKRKIHTYSQNQQVPLFPENRKKLIVGLTISAIILSFGRFVLLPIILRPPAEVVITANEKQLVMDAVSASFKDFSIPDKWQTNRGDYIEVLIPRKLNYLQLYTSVTSNLAVLQDCEYDFSERNKETLSLNIFLHGKPVYKFLFKRKAAVGYVAIVVDDFGYYYNDLVKEFLTFPYSLNISIIPGLPSTRKIAMEASLLSREVLVHMPMEPLEAAFNDDGFILKTGQSTGEIRLRIEQAFSLIPNAIGMNNHQGSKVTANAEIMRVVMRELKKLDKCFIDSYTNSKSVAYKTAKAEHVPTAVNNLFIDAKDEIPFMQSQFARITEMAMKGETVVAICHVRKETLRVLKEQVPVLEEKGIELVNVTAIVN